MTSRYRRSPLALAVLALLFERPLHPYGVLALLKQWGKGDVININQRATVYKTVTRLAEAGLIAVRHTERDAQYPERTLYELTESGREVLNEWLAEMLVGGDREYPEFPAALSFIMLLTPDQALPLLDARRQGAGAAGAELEAGSPRRTGRCRGCRRCRCWSSATCWRWRRPSWPGSTQTVDDLKNKRLDWADAQLRAFADAHTPEIV